MGPTIDSVFVFMLVTLLIMASTGCRARPQAAGSLPDPATTFEDIHSEFLHGNLAIAKNRVEVARAAFSNPSDAWALKFLLLEAEILTYQGNAAEVIHSLQCEAPAFAESGDLALKRDLLCGQAQARLGHFEAANRFLADAQTISIKTQSKLQGELLRTKATVSAYENKLPESRLLYQDSLDQARANNDPFLEATDLSNLGMAALRLQHFDEAVVLLTKSAEFSKKIQARQALQAATGNSGLAYLHLGDYGKALANFQQAEAEARVLGATSGEVAWLWDEGIAHDRLGETEAAQSCYERALEKAKRIQDLDALTGIHTELGFLLYKRGQYASAITHSQAAIQSAASSQDHDAAVKPLFLEALIATRRNDSDTSGVLLLHVESESAGDPETHWAVQAALADFYERRNRPKLADQWYQRAIQTFETQRDTVQAEELKLSFFANGEALYRKYADFLIASHQPDRALELLDRGRARTLSDGLSQSSAKTSADMSSPFRPQLLAKRLNATILFYCLGPERSYLWAIDRETTKLYSLPGSVDLGAAIHRYTRALLKSTDPLREADTDAAYLYNSLVAPAASMLQTDAHVIVVADGDLNQLNFETLIAPAGSNTRHYWIEDVTITNASSIRLLSRTSNAGARDNRLLLIGDPLTSGTGFQGLPHAASEVTRVETQFPQDQRTVITRSSAVPGAYAASQPDRFAYIHFVAHGTASLLSPLDSAVILSPATEQQDGFKLYARDIVQHPIHARLVTISACNGSGTRAYAGEGLVGLSWAFLRAGAHSVIGALWQVDDAATPLIMDHLYADIRTRESAPDAALRNAKLALIHSSGVYRKPLYWAAFQLYIGS